MAAALYARYIPPKTPVHIDATSENAAKGHSQQSSLAQGDLPRKRKRNDKERQSRKKSKAEGDRGDEFSGAVAVESQDEIGVTETQRTSLSNGDTPLPPTPNEQGRSEEPKPQRKGAKSKKNQRAEQEEVEQSEKHSRILSKFQKSIGAKRAVNDRQDEEEKADTTDHEASELHDLVPIPVPDAPAQASARSAFSLLPAWLSRPVAVSADDQPPFKDLKVDHHILHMIGRKGFENAMPIQAGVLPHLLPTADQHPGDLCVSAATGSGKTLGYVLPIVQSLMAHQTTLLRALVIVPTRELVDQVRETAEMCCAGTKLRIGTAIGTQHLDTEQEALVHKGRKYSPSEYAKLHKKLSKRLSADFSDDSESDVYMGFDASDELLNLLPDHVPCYSSRVDILIATPGRLVEHIKSTPGFTLLNLEWLVVDEADRLLDASFQEWAESVINATSAPKHSASLPSILRKPNAFRKRAPRKVVLSATMTRDLEKLNALNLQNPKMVVMERFQNHTENTENNENAGTELPTFLEEHAIPVANGSEKPLYLLGLLHQLLASENQTEQGGKLSLSAKNDISTGHDSDASTPDDTDDTGSLSSRDASGPFPTSTPLSTKRGQGELPNALIFTSSNESAHRLAYLLKQLMPQYQAALTTITKSSTSRSTLKALASFRSSAMRILIATDRASRGLDLPELQNVINYDIPHSITSYIHRIGRTARAGRRGAAWTLVEDREAAWFWKEVAKGHEIGRGNRPVQRTKIALDSLDAGTRAVYGEALAALEKNVKGEAQT